MNEIWNNQSNDIELKHKRNINNRLTDFFRESWINLAKRSHRGFNYLEMTRFECEMKSYLTLPTTNNEIITPLLKMKTGNHKLMTEIGRYGNRKEYDECYCISCDEEKIEDLYHFMVDCVKYKTIRRTITPFLSSLNRTEFYILLNAINRRQLKLINRFIDEALPARDTID